MTTTTETKSTTETRSASFRIEVEKWDRFLEWCKQNNTDSSKILRKHIDEILDSNSDSSSIQSQLKELRERVTALESRF